MPSGPTAIIVSTGPSPESAARDHDVVLLAHPHTCDAVPEGRAQETHDRLRVPHSGSGLLPAADLDPVDRSPQRLDRRVGRGRLGHIARPPVEVVRKHCRGSAEASAPVRRPGCTDHRWCVLALTPADSGSGWSVRAGKRTRWKSCQSHWYRQRAPWCSNAATGATRRAARRTARSPPPAACSGRRAPPGTPPRRPASPRSRRPPARRSSTRGTPGPSGSTPSPSGEPGVQEPIGGHRYVAFASPLRHAPPSRRAGPFRTAPPDPPRLPSSAHPLRIAHPAARPRRAAPHHAHSCVRSRSWKHELQKLARGPGALLDPRIGHRDATGPATVAEFEFDSGRPSLMQITPATSQFVVAGSVTPPRSPTAGCESPQVVAAVRPRRPTHPSPRHVERRLAQQPRSHVRVLANFTRKVNVVRSCSSGTPWRLAVSGGSDSSSSSREPVAAASPSVAPNGFDSASVTSRRPRLPSLAPTAPARSATWLRQAGADLRRPRRQATTMDARENGIGLAPDR